MIKKYFLITYGCQMNHSDSERIASVLESIGYKKAANINEADLIVINMCSIRQSAVNRVYGLVSKFKKLQTKNYKLKTILTGCIANKDLKKFKEHFDYIFSVRALSLWKDFLKKERGFYYPNPINTQFNKKFSADYLKIKPKYLSSPAKTAFISISSGCDNFCAYCVVPFTRGPLICRGHKEILKEAKDTVKKNFKEIWLLGQNVNSYGIEHETDAKPKTKQTRKINFAELLKMVNDIPGNFWLRFTSPHPKDFSDELIETIAKCKKITPYLNLPVQSGDDEILKKMNRPYTAKQYKILVKKIRKAFEKHRKGLEKEVALSTDVIVGFPGETKKQFQNTVKLFKEIKFDMAYISQFSTRPGTAAAKIKDNVSFQEKKRRDKVLTEILKKTALEKNKKYIGKEVEVLINESRIKNQELGISIGKSRHYKTVKLQATSYRFQDLIGQFVKVKIIEATPWGLKGIMKSDKNNKLIVVLGPTAAGKTSLAIKLAQKFNGEIVSADSRQIYKGMDIGTAKAVPAKQTRNKNTKQTQNIIQGIPHYLIDIIEPNKEFNAAVYKKMAIKAIRDIQQRGKLPFLVGGTGLYIKAVVDNLSFLKIPAQEKLARELFKIYQKFDPKGAKLIDKKNKRRLVRAIEVCKVTGKPFWEQRKRGEPLFDILQIGIKLPQEKLQERINKRVEEMLKLGLEKEVKNLVKKYGLKIPPMQTIGYQEWQNFFQNKASKKEVSEKIKLRTIQFAKRQITWFKKDKRIKWIKNYREAEQLIKKF